jgi:hypothetical protein
VAAIVLSCGACVAPALTVAAYEGKAGASAAGAVSAVRTAELAAEELVHDRTFGPTAAVVLQQAEADADSIRGQFGSIQPPGPSADRLRAQLVPLLTRASDALAELRIAARRGDIPALAARTPPLGDLAAQLERFAEAHE